MDTKEILFTVVGFAMSFYGGQTQQLFWVVSGILLIILSIWLKLSETEEEIRIINAQINTQNEIKRLWRKIDEIDKKYGKKRQN